MYKPRCFDVLLDARSKVCIIYCFSVPISLATILEYVGDSKRCLIEGEDVLNCEHVIECSVAPGPALGVLRVVGYVLQSSALHGEPHTVNLDLNHGKILSISCSCVAG